MCIIEMSAQLLVQVALNFLSLGLDPKTFCSRNLEEQVQLLSHFVLCQKAQFNYHHIL